MALLDAIDRDELRQFVRTSNARAAWVTVVNFVLIAAGFALPAVWHNAVAWVLGSILLGARAMALGVLTHDTAHSTFFSSRRLNEWAGTWLFGSLPNVPYKAYRTGHLAHHRNAGTGQDLDLAFVDSYPATAASLRRKLLRDVSGLNGIKNVVYQIKAFRLQAQTPFLLAHAVLFALLWLLSVPQVYACWWLGQIFVYPLVMRLRVMSEHGGVPDHLHVDPRRNTGTTLAGPVGRLLLGPNGVNFHIEHHLAAAVPLYRLRDLHRLLVARGYYAGHECIATSYFAVIRRCLATDTHTQTLGTKRIARGSLSNMQ